MKQFTEMQLRNNIIHLNAVTSIVKKNTNLLSWKTKRNCNSVEEKHADCSIDQYKVKDNS